MYRRGAGRDSRARDKGQRRGQGSAPAVVSRVGVKVWGLEFRVWGLGFGVWGLGFGVWGLGLGFRVLGCS